MWLKVMEVVSISNLVTSENEKNFVIVKTCNSQAMAINSFVIPHDWQNGNLCISAKIKLLLVSLWQNCEIVP